jgi:hypothetical protein
MTSDMMKFLNDDDFLKWMAVCNKKNRKSAELLEEITLPYTRKRLAADDNKLTKAVVLDYIRRNLTLEDFEAFESKIQSKNKEKKTLENSTVYNKRSNNTVSAVKFEALESKIQSKNNEKKILENSNDYNKQINNTVSAVKFEENSIIKFDKKLIADADKVNEIIGFGDEVSNKFREIKKMFGGSMNEGMR